MKTKTAGILLILLLAFSGFYSAQAQYKSISLGFRAAPGIGWFKSDQENYNTEGVVPCFAWGLVTEFYFAENYAFATGFSFDFLNGKLSYPMMGVQNAGLLTRKYRLKVLEIPAMIKMKTNEINGLRYFGQIGLGGGVRLNSKAEDVFTESGKPEQTTDFRLIDSQTRLFRASLIVGAGVEYPFDNSTSLVAGINFNNGFTNVLKGDNSVNSSLEHHGVPNSVELSIAIMF